MKSLRKILAEEGLTASRPGPQWDPWPVDSRAPLQRVLNVYGDYSRQSLFRVLFEDASDAEFRLVGKLLQALKAGDQKAARRVADQMKKGSSSFAESVRYDNDLWSILLG